MANEKFGQLLKAMKILKKYYSKNTEILTVNGGIRFLITNRSLGQRILNSISKKDMDKLNEWGYFEICGDGKGGLKNDGGYHLWVGNVS